MDIVMRPRQGGKTYKVAHILVNDESSVLIVGSAQHKDGMRDLVRKLVHDKLDREGRSGPVVRAEIDRVMDRIFVAGDPRTRFGKGYVMVDGLEDVLQRLLGVGIDVATMDMPSEAGRAYRVHFEEQQVATAWALEDEHRAERRAKHQAMEVTFGARFGAGVQHMADVMEPELTPLEKERASRIEMDRIHNRNLGIKP